MLWQCVAETSFTDPFVVYSNGQNVQVGTTRQILRLIELSSENGKFSLGVTTDWQ